MGAGLSATTPRHAPCASLTARHAVAVLSWTHTPGAGAPLAKTSVPVKQVCPAGTCVGQAPPVPGVGVAGVGLGVGVGVGVASGVAVCAPVGKGVGNGVTGTEGCGMVGAGVPEAAGVCVGEGEGVGEGVGVGVGIAVGRGVAVGVAGTGVGVAGVAVCGGALGPPLVAGTTVAAGAAGEGEAAADADGGAAGVAVTSVPAEGWLELPVGALARGRCAVGRHAQAVARKAATSGSAIRRNRMSLPPRRDYPSAVARRACYGMIALIVVGPLTTTPSRSTLTTPPTRNRTSQARPVGALSSEM